MRFAFFARIAALPLAVVFMSAAAAAQSAVVDNYPDIAAAYAVAVDGELKWAGKPDARRQPASLAKLLSALALLDSGWDPETIVTVGTAAAGVEGSRIGLRRGEQLRASDLLTGMLVRSGNDACLALAEHAAGSMAAFAKRMNQYAARLGMKNSNFIHPCGLDASGQHTTVRDLMLLAEAARLSPEIRRRAAMENAVVKTVAGRELRFNNTNALIGRAPEINGLKSGFTSGAGNCVIALGERSGHYALAVLLGATDRWWEATGLIAQALGTVAFPIDR
jgi:D-alanyl-D-alanine carboxypeptidase (penicillin-binding protein 5/6)